MADVPADFVADVRDALSVSSSYDPRVARLVKETLTKLLRDYNFPKSVMRWQSPVLAFGATSTPQPAGLKKPLFLQLVEPAVGGAPAGYLQLHRSDIFRLPQRNGAPCYYWLQGTDIAWDTPLGESTLLLDFFYQSLDADAALSWFITEFPDVLRNYSVYRIAGDMRKSDVATLYQGYSQDDLQSISIYLNELEWNTVEMSFKERDSNTSPAYTPRYGF